MNRFLLLLIILLVHCDLNPTQIDFMEKVALRLLYRENQFSFFPINTPKDENSVVMYACPEHYQYFQRLNTLHRNAKCIIPKLDTDMSTENCIVEFVPTIKNKGDCDHGGTLFTFQYDICYKNSENGKEDLYPLVIYSFCFHPTERRTLYTLHKISSIDWLHRLFNASGPFGCAKFLDYKPFENFDYDFEDVFILYAKQEMAEDYLIPEILIPLDDLEMELGRGVNLHFHNVSALWKSKYLDWDRINEAVWQNVKKNGLIEPIKTSVSEIYDEVVNESGTKISVGLLWWKHVITAKHRYVVVLYNTSSENPRQVRALCPDSICNEFEVPIDTFTNIQCCRDDKSVMNRLEGKKNQVKWQN